MPTFSVPVLSSRFISIDLINLNMSKQTTRKKISFLICFIVVITLTILIYVVNFIISRSYMTAEPTTTTISTTTTITTSTTIEPFFYFPIKLPSAYTLLISFPSKEGSVIVKKGGSVVLPVTIKSWADKPIKINFTLVEHPFGNVPEFLRYEGYKVPEEYITLDTRETLHTQIKIIVSENAQLGSYLIGICGELKEPVEGRSGECQVFELVVIE